MSENTKKSGWKKAWEIAQTVGAGAGLAALKISMEKAGEKAGEKVAEKFSKAVGLTAEEAEKSDKDEIATRRALILGKFPDPDKKEFLEWLGRLRKSNPKLANEVTRRIYNIFAELTKKTTRTGKDKDTKVSESNAEAILVAKDLIREILDAPENERLSVLERANIVFEEKPKKIIDKTADFITEKVTKKGGELIEGQKKNFKNLRGLAAQKRAEAERRWKGR